MGWVEALQEIAALSKVGWSFHMERSSQTNWQWEVVLDNRGVFLGRTLVQSENMGDAIEEALRRVSARPGPLTTD